MSAVARSAMSTASNRNQLQTPMTRIASILACAFVSIIAPQIARAADVKTGQLCWAVGKLDNTVYFAGIEEREDRSASFASLIEISGIEAFPVKCLTLPLASYRALRDLLVQEWKDAELEIIDTTFLSDLDY
jgi:hypothetical protein